MLILLKNIIKFGPFVSLRIAPINTLIHNSNTNINKNVLVSSIRKTSFVTTNMSSINEQEDEQFQLKDINDEEKLYVQRITKMATIPERGSKYAAGFDLSSAENITIPSKSRGVIKTDLIIKVPQGTYGRIAPRSGLAIKKFIDIGAGVIDSDYRGNVGIVIFNFGDEDFEVNIGDRIAQLVLEKIWLGDVEEVNEIKDLTERGDGGFGSTGV